MSNVSARIIKANALAAVALLSANSSYAQTKFTAKVAMEKMSHQERVAYISGIVEGMAYARFRKDSAAKGVKVSTGSACIRDWYDSKAPDGRAMYAHIEANFVRFPDYTPAEIIATMVKKKCGE